MKTKILAIVLSLLMLVQPTMAIGMVGMESAEETTVSYVETVEAETDAALAADDEVILFDDFENAADGFTTANKPAFATDNGGLSSHYSNGDVGAGTIATVDGNNVMLVSASLGNWNDIGIRFNNLPIVNVGTYKLTFKAYRCLTSGYESITNWSGYHMNWGSANYNNFKTVKDEEWVTYTETFVVKEVDGEKTINWTKDDNSTGTLTYSDAGQTVHFYMIANGASTAGTADGKISTGTTMSWYLDDVSLTYEAPEILAENIVLRENFEKVSENWTYENNTFSYDASTTATKAIFVNTDRTGASATMSSVVDTSENADSAIAANGTKAFMLKNRVNNYALTGFSINNLPLANVGTYELSFKSFAVDVTETNFRSISTFIGSEGSYGTPVLGEWKTYTTAITVTETDGVKTADIVTREGKKYSLALTNGVLATPVQFIWIGDNTKTEGYYTIYIDDILLTYEAPAVPAAISFVDTEGNAFEYTSEATGTYTLPTAATLGLAYEPAFTYEGVTYAAGEKVSIAKGTTKVEFVVSENNIIFKADGAATPTFATGEAADAVVKGTVKDGAYECNYSGWGANLIADGLKLGSYGTYTFDYDVIHSGTDEFALHTMLYNSTSGGDGVTSIQPGVLIKNGKTHISHSVTIYEKDGAPYFKNREDKEFALDTHGYFPSVRAVSMGTQSSGKFMLDNLTISFTPAAPEALDLVGYRIADEGGKGGPSGMRFASFVTDTQIESATEYGFIVTLKDSITTAGVADYDKVNLEGVTADRTSSISATNSDGVKVLAGAAFNENTNKVYALDGSTFSNGTISYKGVFETFFTGVLYGIPEGQEDTIFVARPYIVVDGVFYYGNCVERSYNQVLDAAGIG